MMIGSRGSHRVTPLYILNETNLKMDPAPLAAALRSPPAPRKRHRYRSFKQQVEDVRTSCPLSSSGS